MMTMMMLTTMMIAYDDDGDADDDCEYVYDDYDYADFDEPRWLKVAVCHQGGCGLTPWEVADG